MDIKIKRSSRKYLRKKLKKMGIKYDNERAKENLKKLVEPYNYKLPENFRIIIDKEDELNGRNIAFSGHRKICLSSRYLLEYISGDDREFIGKCILECIGHELGHNKAATYVPMFWISKIACIKLATAKDKFKARLVEVFCDHTSLGFTGFGVDIHKAVMNVHLKRRNDKTDFLHPTWAERIRYIGKEFDENLIRQIAADNGFNDDEFISEQIRYYEKVNKDGGYLKKSDVVLSVINILLSVVLIFSFIGLLALITK